MPSTNRLAGRVPATIVQAATKPSNPRKRFSVASKGRTAISALARVTVVYSSAES